MPLMTLDQVKGKLDIPLDVLDKDVEVEASRKGAERHLLDLCGYSLAGGIFTDVFRGVPRSATLQTEWRPVVAVVSLQGRSAGGSMEALQYDILDSKRGQISVAPLSGVWPPSNRAFGSNFRRREWEVIEVQYSVAAMPTMEDFSDVAAAICATWFTLDQSLGREQVDIGIVRERYRIYGLPEHLSLRLEPHIRRRSKWAR